MKPQILLKYGDNVVAQSDISTSKGLGAEKRPLLTNELIRDVHGLGLAYDTEKSKEIWENVSKEMGQKLDNATEPYRSSVNSAHHSNWHSRRLVEAVNTIQPIVLAAPVLAPMCALALLALLRHTRRRPQPALAPEGRLVLTEF